MGQNTAVVFGASGGIGSATVEAFLRRGCKVVAVDPIILPARERVTSISARVDRADHEVFGEIASYCAGSAAHVSIAIGGATTEEVGLDGRILDLDQESLLNATVRSNLVEVVAVAIGMARIIAPNSSVTIASSINAFGDFGFPFYSAAKAGVDGFVRSSAREFGRRGVRLNAISFGTVQTPRSSELHGQDQGHFRRLTRLAATGRLTTPSEAGVAMTTMALDLTNVTGTVLVYDGGQSISGDHSIA